jgi:pilus assembly protein Flp/PilA
MMKTRMQLALQNALAKHQNRESGQGLVEYALILVLVAVVVIVILSQLGPSISNIFNEINDALGGDFAQSDELPELCIGDIAPPTEYYFFPAGTEFIANATYYSDNNCQNGATPAGITVIRPSLSEAQADLICQAQHGVDASVNAPGDIWYCS